MAMYFTTLLAALLSCGHCGTTTHQSHGTLAPPSDNDDDLHDDSPYGGDPPNSPPPWWYSTSSGQDAYDAWRAHYYGTTTVGGQVHHSGTTRHGAATTAATGSTTSRFVSTTSAATTAATTAAGTPRATTTRVQTTTPATVASTTTRRVITTTRQTNPTTTRAASNAQGTSQSSDEKEAETTTTESTTTLTETTSTRTTTTTATSTTRTTSTTTTTTHCGCDVCWVRTKTVSEAAQVSWDVTEAGRTICSSPSFADGTETLSLCCLSLNRTYSLTCRDSAANGWGAGFVQIHETVYCGDGSSFSTSSWPFPLPTPFEVVAGTACEVQGTCLRSTRRRRQGVPSSCQVQVAPATGPISVTGTLAFQALFTLNGVGYTSIQELNNVRPHGVITYTPEPFGGSGDWTICAPPLTGTRALASGTSSQPALEDVGEADTSQVVLGVLNGAGTFFEHSKAQEGTFLLSRLACEATHGEGACTRGSCGCFSYFYRSGGLSCSCDKAVGEFEWVFANRGCSYVSSDYGGTGQSVQGIANFVRKRIAGDCASTSWALVQTGFTERTPNFHVIADYRVDSFRAGRSSWFTNVPNGPDAAFLVQEPTLREDATAGAHIVLAELDATIVLSKAMPEAATFAAWVWLPAGTASGTILTDRNYGDGRNFTLDDFSAANSNLRAAAWSHVAQVWVAVGSSFTAFLFLNGQFAGLTVMGPLARVAGQPLTLGGGASNVWLSDIAIFDRSLSRDEIVELFRSGRPSATAGTRRSGRSLASRAPWAVVAGDCSVQGSCAKSVHFPLTVSPNETCSLTGPGLDVSVAGVLSRSVLVNGQPFAVAADVAGNTSYGWQVCLPQGPTMCGENCATRASVVCSSNVQACTNSLLAASLDCSLPGDTPKATLSSCDERAWVQLDLGSVMTVGSVTLFSSCSKQQHCGRQLQISSDASTWETVFKQGPGFGVPEGQRGLLMSFGAQEARYLRVWSSFAMEAQDASFLRVAVSSTCEDNGKWRDKLFGSGQMSCESLAARPSWCFQRSLYSKEAQTACPASCGVCSAPYAKLDGQCRSRTMIDEDFREEVIVTSMVCYHHCLVESSCTHFEWEPGVACRRYKGCAINRQPSRNPDVQTFAVPDAQLSAPQPVTQKYYWSGSFVDKGMNGACLAVPEDAQECADASSKLGHPNSEFLPPGSPCRCKACSASFWNRISGSCVGQYSCICKEETEGSVVLSSTSLIPPDRLTISLEQPRSGVATTMTQMCLISNVSRCRGKSWNIMSLGATPLRLGAKIFPYPTDLDGDGDLDLLIGRGTGDLVFLENIAGTFDTASAIGIARATVTGKVCLQAWESQADSFCGHWCCSVQNLGDICFTGDSGWESCQSATAFGVSVQSNLHPVAVDWDGDGITDILAGSCDGQLHFFKGQGGRSFAELTGASNPFTAVASALSGTVTCTYPDIADWDKDGDLDLIIGTDLGEVAYYENVYGVLQAREGGLNPFQHATVVANAVPTAIDMDRDGDVDLIVGGSDGTLHYFERLGHGTLVPREEIPNLAVAQDSIPRAADLDGDGDVDFILVDGVTGGLTIWLSQPDETLAEQLDEFNPFDDLKFDYFAIPQAVDWDGDGRLELLVGGVSGHVHHYAASQDATPQSVADSPLDALAVWPHPAQHAVDWDADGDVDLLVGYEGGKVMYFERLADNTLAPGIEILSASPGSYASPHAVDWDRDGDMDLLLGDSGNAPPRTIHLEGFAISEWNTAYVERKGIDMLIGNHPVFASESTPWVIAYCRSSTAWFLFSNTSKRWDENRAGKCKGAGARTGAQFLVDRSKVGQGGHWEIHGSYSNQGNSQQPPAGVRTAPVSSDGTTERPHCDPCTGRGADAECGTCALSPQMQGICAKELCEAQDFSGGAPSALRPVPAHACGCINSDQGQTDRYGATCNDYILDWCGRFDDTIFNATDSCCICGGGKHTDVSRLESFSVDAACFDVDMWFPVADAKVANVTPAFAAYGSLRFFERVDLNSSTLVERPAAASPFGDITAASRLFPVTVDWDQDGLLDLLLGSASDEVATLASNGTAEAPHCSLAATSTCRWDDAAKGQCARAFCRAAGYASGTLLGEPADLCTATAASSPIYSYGLDSNSVAESTPDMVVSVTALCVAGGNIRYFQGRASGLVELLGSQNPFDGIVKAELAAAAVVDWDLDGELEVLVGDNSRELSYFKRGKPCQQEHVCSRRGVCHSILGTCGCNYGYSLGDCSRCDVGYYTERSTSATASACLPCPGVGSKAGVCAARGLCSDDERSRSLSGASNSSVVFYTGSGACECSTHFSGDCSAGLCPAGMELKLSNLSISACFDCQPGYFKGQEGNGLCEVCPAGSYAATSGASSCEACPAGKSQPRSGQDVCQPCVAGKATAAGSAECSVCDIGKYAAMEEMEQCHDCPPGKWSEVVGAVTCADCAAGLYGPGSQACQSCPAGRFAGQPGHSDCTLCDSGRYSSKVGADNKEVCLPCAEGKYSGTAGQSEESSCVRCVVGATTLDKASTDGSMCIQPNEEDFRCTSGKLCRLNITGNGLREGHRVAISSSISKVSTNGYEYEWSEPLSQGGGLFDLKWCPGVRSTCANPETEFLFFLGKLEVVGPFAASAFTCVRGRSCAGLGPVAGIGLDGVASKIRVVTGACGGAEVRLHAQKEADGMVDVHVENITNAVSITFGFGDVPVTVEPSNRYQVCWCAETTTTGCLQPQSYTTLLAPLVIEGPRPGHEVTCFLGQHCVVEDIQGENLKAGDRLMVMDICGAGGQVVPGVPGGSIAEATEADASRFEFLKLPNSTGSQVLESVAGIYRLCFCRAVLPNMTCNAPADFSADVGLFTAKGPYKDHNFGCYLGTSCFLRGLRGIGLLDGDSVLVQQEECSQKGDEAAPGLPSKPISAIAGGSHFLMGKITTAVPGPYHVCWRPASKPSGPFGTSVGQVFVTCPKGTYGFGNGCEVCPLGHYCTGGSELDAGDDEKTRCLDVGATTLTTGADKPANCLCNVGQKKGSSSCQPCETGRFKPNISDEATCPGKCPNGTTSRTGASSPDHCYSTAISEEERLDEAEVFVLEGNLTLELSCDRVQQYRAEVELQRAIAQMLGIDESEVVLDGADPSNCADAEKGDYAASAGQRRLQATPPSTSFVVFRIRRASQSEVERLKEMINFPELAVELEDIAVFQPGNGELFISSEKLTCKENMAFPRGSRPTSLDDCTCSLGYYHATDEGSCKPCARGDYKSLVGDVQCRQCGTQLVGAVTVQLTTLEEGTVLAANCTCPAGYYMQDASGCAVCPERHFCTGGAHIQECPAGSTTIGEGKKVLTDCVCDKGQRSAPSANETVRCQPCPQGTYKTIIASSDCVQSCPQHSSSPLGAVSQEFCFCEQGYFYEPAVNGVFICQPCTSEGVNCSGGFDPPGSLNHTEPSSIDGFYLTGFSIAEECFITAEGGGSVCLQGATFSNQKGACTGSQTGLLCGACEHLTARDQGDEPCVSCDPNYPSYMYVASLLMDLCLKAAFGMFLGKQAMVAVMRIRKMDAIILRILLQWITAVSVLQTFDLASLTLYSWGQDEALREQQAKAAAAGEKLSASAFQRAAGINFRFDFPEEFLPVWNSLMVVKGSIPSLQSPQASIECLVQRQFESAEIPSTTQLLGPAIFWLSYPILVLATVYVFCLIFAKLLWPFLMWLAERAKKKLSKMLLSAGASEKNVQRSLKKLNQRAAMELIEDPSALTNTEGLNHFFGEEVCREVMAAGLAKVAGERILGKVEDLIKSDEVEEDKKNALQAIHDGGQEGLREFLEQLLKVMDPEDFAGTLTNPCTDKLEDAIESMPASELMAVVQRIKGTPVEVVEDEEEDDTYTRIGTPKNFEEEHTIFGVFRNSSCRTVFVDAYPLYLVTLYSIWDTTTRRMLSLLQVKRILVTLPGGQEVVQGRWLYDTRFEMFQGPHLWVGIIGVIGLGVWSIGFLLALYLKIRKNRYKLQETEILMNYGYFYNGLEPDTYWWDVSAKKLDVLCVYCVTFTEIFHDPKAKLTMYLGLAGVFWAAHNIYHPFDDRHNSLADRLEGAGLTVRFVTLFLLQTLLILSADALTNAIFASFILLINVLFMAAALFVLLIEMPESRENEDEDEGAEKPADEMEGKGSEAGRNFIQKTLGGSGNPVQQAIAKIASLIMGYFVGKLFEVVMKVALVLASVREAASREVPHIGWQGPGRHYLLTQPKKQKMSIPRRLLAKCLRVLYKLGEEDQRAFLAQTVGQFLDHLMTNSECQMLPANILDIFFAMPIALAREKAQKHHADLPLHIRVAHRIGEMVDQPCSGVTAFSEEDLETKHTCTLEDLSQTSTAEDLNAALIWIQRLSERDVWEFIRHVYEPSGNCTPSRAEGSPRTPLVLHATPSRFGSARSM